MKSLCDIYDFPVLQRKMNWRSVHPPATDYDYFIAIPRSAAKAASGVRRL